MIYTLFVLAIILLCLLIVNFRDKYTLLFITMAGGMFAILFSRIADIARNGNYFISPGGVFDYDYSLFLLFSRAIHMGLSGSLILGNAGIALYLSVQILFFFEIRRNAANRIHMFPDARTRLGFLRMMLFPVWYFVFYHPATGYRLYLLDKTLWGDSRVFSVILRAADLASYAFILCFLLAPIVLLFALYRRTQAAFFKNQLLSLLLSLTFLDFSFAAIFVLMRNSVDARGLLQSGMWNIRFANLQIANYVVIMPAVILVLMAAAATILVNNKLDNILNVFRSRALRRNLERLNANMRDLLHYQKNLMFSIRILAQKAAPAAEGTAAIGTIEEIRDLADANIADLSGKLDSIRNFRLDNKTVDVGEVLRAAVDSVCLPPGTVLDAHYPDAPVWTLVDVYHLKNLTVNLLKNAIQAIAAAGREEGRIRLVCELNYNWIHFSLTDNGCGIPRKNRRKIFFPYFSTKSSGSNFGVGLSYVMKVVDAYTGHIAVDSKVGEYTRFEILLPRLQPGKGMDP